MSVVQYLGFKSSTSANLLFFGDFQWLDVPDGIGILVDTSICIFTLITAVHRMVGEGVPEVKNPILATLWIDLLTHSS